LVVSYYGKNIDAYSGHYDYFHHKNGSKWEGIHDFCTQNKDFLMRYDFVWFPDDDLLVNGKSITKFFKEVKKYKFSIAQPALGIGSYFTHSITLKSPCSNARQTNFVEIMAPCFSIEMLSELIPTFNENKSGWGFEWLWASKAEQMNKKIGIIDSVCIVHTRAVGSAGHGGSSSPHSEGRELGRRLGLKFTRPKNIKKYSNGFLCQSVALLYPAFINRYVYELIHKLLR
jgi:hypothetical protein